MSIIGKVMGPLLAAGAAFSIAVVAAMGIAVGTLLWTPPQTAEAAVAVQEAATSMPVADAFKPLGNKLVRVFHFDNTAKEWVWYDPEVPGLGGLTTMESGKSYWILVSETVEGVVLNGRSRRLTCVNDNCWNIEGW